MLSFINIKTVAKYERRILARGWFFRIFAFIAILFSAIWCLANTFGTGSYNWNIRALPSGIIYGTMMMMNIAQSIIAVFLASDFLKRDKKMDTSEVLFIRPMSNSDYVLGKTWGIISLFIRLNLIGLTIAILSSISSGNFVADIGPYILYFFLMNITTLIFMLGLSYLLMSILKNQAVTFLILIAFIISVLFGLGEKLSYIFDFLAFSFPLLYSDAIGLSNWPSVIQHRMMFALVGTGSILLSIALLQRLTQHHYTKLITSTLGLFALLCAIYVGAKYYTSITDQQKLREEMRLVNHQLYSEPIPLISHCDIIYKQGDKNKITAHLTLKNNNKIALDEYVFSLNNGFEILSVTNEAGQALDFQRNLHILKVIPAEKLAVGNSQKITITYEGNINEYNSYLDTEDEAFYAAEKQFPISRKRTYGFDGPEYTLLSIENLWYPIAGVRYDPTLPAVFYQQFTQFTLDVETSDGLIPIAQGKQDSIAPNKYKFVVKDPIPQFSLAIGDYKKAHVEVKGINISLFYLSGHDKRFAELEKLNKDTISDLLYDFLDEFERPIRIYYPYERFSLVETPVQFSSNSHSWTSSYAQSQPQMVFLPELGYGLFASDFKSELKRAERREKRENTGYSEKDMQAVIFTNFIKSTFASFEGRVNFANIKDGVPPNPYCIFPNYYNYVNFMSSSKYPVINYAFESYLLKGEDNMRNNMISRSAGLSDEELANILLDGKSLKTIIKENVDKVSTTKVLKSKGDYLLSWLQAQAEDENFEEFLIDFLDDNTYKEITFERFCSVINERFDIDLNAFMDQWYNSSELPAYLFSDIKIEQGLSSDNELIYTANIKISNLGKAPGMVKFSFRSGGGRGMRGGGGSSSMETDDRYVTMEANQTKEVHMVLYDSPRGVSINTLISKNIPNTINVFGSRPEKNDYCIDYDYEKVLEEPVTFRSGNEIIVDNVDAGFTTVDPQDNSIVKKFFKEESTSRADQFSGMGFGASNSSNWALHSDGQYFGDYEKSAMFCKAGEGNKKAIWSADIQKEGYYDVFVHLPRPRAARSRRSGGGGGGGGGDRNKGGQKPVGEYTYTVSHSDGSEQVVLAMEDVESGWNLLGNYYFLNDTTSITLTDLSTATTVIADAVKWVPSE